MKSSILSAAVLVAFAGLASAQQPILEVEPNNSQATAQDIGAFTGAGGSKLVDGSVLSFINPLAELSAADQDWYRFTVSGPATIVATLYNLSDSGNLRIELHNASGATLAQGTDPNITGFASFRAVKNLPAGEYAILVSGVEGSSFDYKLVIATNIPTPGTAGLAGLAGLAALRRKR